MRAAVQSVNEAGGAGSSEDRERLEHERGGAVEQDAGSSTQATRASSAATIARRSKLASSQASSPRLTTAGQRALEQPARRSHRRLRRRPGQARDLGLREHEIEGTGERDADCEREQGGDSQRRWRPRSQSASVSLA